MNDVLAPPEGFTPYRAFEAEGSRIGICWCYACGAAIVIDKDDLFDPFEIHRRWHARFDAVAEIAKPL